MNTATAIDVTVSVGSESVAREDFSPHWLMEQLRRQHSRCVGVDIDHPDVHVLLSSYGCPAAGGGSRMPTRKESAIFDLWEACGMKRADWTPGNLEAFLQRLRRFL